MKIALVHDWLTGMRGGEKSLHELLGLFPNADLHTLIHVQGSCSERIENRPIFTSALSRLPSIRRYYRMLLPLFPWAIERLDLRGYDLVLSTSHAVAKGVRTQPGTAHVCYCFTPMRYVWDHVDLYLGKGPRRLLATPLIHALRRWDRRTSSHDRVTKFFAISKTVAQRIECHYRRQAPVIYPPVDVDAIRPSGTAPEDFFLLVGGFVPYKGEAIAIEAFRKLGSRLIVAGDGPSRRRCEASAPPNVEFTGRISDAELTQLYQDCRALIYPQEEDFGIVAVEAQAAGRPVIAFGKGGGTETVISIDHHPNAATGIWFEEPNSDALVNAVLRFENLEPQFSSATIRRQAERFSVERFHREFSEAISPYLPEKTNAVARK